MTLILFDVDGTLVDSQNLIVAAQREAFLALGLEPPSRERSLSIVGLSLVEAFTTLAGARAPIAELAQAYRDAVHRMREEPEDCEPLYDGAGRLVADLAGRDGITLGIATGKPRRDSARSGTGTGRDPTRRPWAFTRRCGAVRARSGPGHTRRRTIVRRSPPTLLRRL